MIPLWKAKRILYICEKFFCYDENKKSEYELYHKVRDHCHYTGKFIGAAHNICNLRYHVPKKIPIVFHHGSTYDYHFVINKLAEEFKGEFECLGENTEKYITFSVPLKKENYNGEIITYKLKFIEVIYLCKLHYQILLITYLEFMIKNAKNVWKEKN